MAIIKNQLGFFCQMNGIKSDIPLDRKKSLASDIDVVFSISDRHECYIGW